MSIKELLKPTIGKLIVVVGLYFVSYYASFFVHGFTDVGLPFVYYKGSFGFPFLTSGGSEAQYNYLNLVLDIVVWYLLSAAIVYGIVQIRKKHGNLNNTSPNT